MVITDAVQNHRSADVLLCRAQQGDATAFCELIEPHQARLLRQAIALGNDSFTAEDLVQQTLIEAWRSFSRFRQQCRLTTWLYAILLHRFHKHLRARSRRPVPVSTLATADIEQGEHLLRNRPANEATPAEAMQQAERVDTIRDLVTALSPKHQQVILLRFMEQAALKEIAAVLDCSIGTVKSRLHHAIAHLRKMQMNLTSSGGDTSL